MNTSNYIKKHYSILAYGLCILFVIAVAVSAYVTYDKQTSDITIGIIILLFSDLVLAILTLVSMVAMFSEVSRLHAREFPADVIDQMNKLDYQLEQLSYDFNAEKKHFEMIISISKACTQLKERMDKIDSNLDGINPHTEKSGKKKIKDFVKSVINWVKKSFSLKRKDTPEAPISTETQDNIT